MNTYIDLAEESDNRSKSIQPANAARGFQGHRRTDRYESMFNDFNDEDTHSMPYNDYEDQNRAFNSTALPPKPQPYEDTVLMMHFNKQGIRFMLQANLKTFILIVVIVLFLFGRPGVGDLITTLVKSLSGGQ